MTKILTGSIVQNPTNLLAGSTIDGVIDRGAILFSQAHVYWDGANVVTSGNVELQTENPDGSFAINSLPSGTYALGSDQLLIAYASKTAGTTTLSIGTYPNLTAGQYAIVNLSSLNAIDLLRKDHYVFFRCRLTTASVPQLIIPLNKQVLIPGTSSILGTLPAVAMVEYVDPISTTLPTGSSVMIDGNAGVNGNRVLYTNLASGNNQIYTLGGVGTSITWTPLAAFPAGVSPSNGDRVEALLGTTYSDAMGVFNGTTWNFGDVTRYIGTSGDYWEQTSIRTTSIVDGSTNTIFSVPALGTENMVINYSVVRGNRKETGQLFVTNNGLTASVSTDSVYITDIGVSFSAILSGSNVVVSYTATSLGQNGSMRYFVQRWSDEPGGPAGIPAYSAITTIPIGYLNASYAQSDGSAVANNCSEPTVVGGVTQLVLNYTYTVGVNSGTTAGDLEVIVDGQVIPRYLAGVTTTAYYTEVNNTTIKFWANLTSPAVSLEVRRKAGTVDTSSSNAAKIAAMFDIVVGSPTQVLQGVAQYSSINTAIQSSSTGYNILVLNGTYNETVLVDRQVVLLGKGFSTVINGGLTFGATTNNAAVSKFHIIGNLTFNSGSIGNYVETCWGNSAGTTTDLGEDNLYTVIRN